MTESRQADPILSIPEGVSLEAANALWTPDGLEHVQSWIVGRDRASGRYMVKHEFRFTFKGETRYFGIVAQDDDPDDQIEDLAGNMVLREAKRIIETLQKRGSKLVPEQIANEIPIRRELAAVFRDYLRHARKRAKTTTGRIYQPAIGEGFA